MSKFAKLDKTGRRTNSATQCFGNLNTSIVKTRAEVVHDNAHDGDAPTRTVIQRSRVPKTPLERLQDILPEPEAGSLCPGSSPVTFHSLRG